MSVPPPPQVATATLLTIMAAGQQSPRGCVSPAELKYYLYLAELLGPAYGLWGLGFGFRRVDYGLESEWVDTALEFLSWHGLVSTTDAGIAPSLVPEAELSEIRTGFYVGTLASLLRDLVGTLAGLGAARLAEVCSIVYEEPAFDALLSTKPTEKDAPLPPSGADHPSTTVQAIALFAHSRIAKGRRRKNPRAALMAYLRFLAVRAASPDQHRQ